MWWYDLFAVLLFAMGWWPCGGCSATPTACADCADCDELSGCPRDFEVISSGTWGDDYCAGCDDGKLIGTYAVPWISGCNWLNTGGTTGVCYVNGDACRDNSNTAWHVRVTIEVDKIVVGLNRRGAAVGPFGTVRDEISKFEWDMTEQGSSSLYDCRLGGSAQTGTYTTTTQCNLGGGTQCSCDGSGLTVTVQETP